jgi:hypothetical protein
MDDAPLCRGLLIEHINVSYSQCGFAALMQPTVCTVSAAHVSLCVQLNVVDANTAKKFYIDVLGCRLNPVGTQRHQVGASLIAPPVATCWKAFRKTINSNRRVLQTHVNLGLSQFHLPHFLGMNGAAVTVPQVVSPLSCAFDTICTLTQNVGLERAHGTQHNRAAFSTD